jgi:hypothetical protein
MDYNKFFTFQRCFFDLLSDRSDKVGVVTLVATKKNIFFKEGERVNIGLYKNYQHGRMLGIAPVRDFITYFDTGDDFLEFLFDLWEKNKPLMCTYA